MICKNHDFKKRRVQLYQFTSHVWGINFSTFVELFGIGSLITESPTNASTVASTTIENNRYMDDLLLASNSLDDIKQISRESTSIYRRCGIVVGASALQPVDLGFISLSQVMPKDYKKMVFTASLPSAHHKRDVKNKPTGLLVVSLRKALNGMPPSLCGIQVVGPSSLPVVVAQSN